MLDTARSDHDLAMDVIGRLIGPGVHPEQRTYFVIDGEPKAKMRARHSVRRGFVRTYTPEETVNAQTRLAAEFTKALNGHRFESSIAIAAVFFRPNYQRIDADNLMKLVMDAGTQAGAWIDDCYVTAQASYIELDHERPRTLVVMAAASSSMDRTARFACTVCDAPFTRAGRATFKNPPKCCSRECRAVLHARDRAVARCLHCDKEFKRTNAGQSYCSRACSRTSPRVRQPDTSQRPWPKCSVCGGRVSRREYTRCSNCSPKGRKIGSKNRARLVSSVIPPDPR